MKQIIWMLSVVFVTAVACVGCPSSKMDEPRTMLGKPHNSSIEVDGIAGGEKQNDTETAGERPRENMTSQDKKRLDAPDRKIIFSADIRIIVPDFPKAEQGLDQIIQAHNGYVAKADLSGSAGGNRNGQWTVRIPAVKFREFNEATKSLGDLDRYGVDTREVTEEYYDLQARIKNKEAELDSLRKIFDKGDGKVGDVLLVQRELSRASGDLEQMVGRQRVLENLVDLTTIKVRMQERGSFTPTAPVTFSSQIADTFTKSLETLVSAGKGLTLAAVAITPWLPVLAVVSVIAWLSLRRWRMNSSRLRTDLPPQATP